MHKVLPSSNFEFLLLLLSAIRNPITRFTTFANKWWVNIYVGDTDEENWVRIDEWMFVNKPIATWQTINNLKYSCMSNNIEESSKWRINFLKIAISWSNRSDEANHLIALGGERNQYPQLTRHNNEKNRSCDLGLSHSCFRTRLLR